MSQLPAELKYAASHEWARLDGDVVTVGITDHAQDALGDLVFVELPTVGDVVSAGQEAGVVESVKAASDIYAPVSGEIIAINEALVDAPEIVNTEPYTGGWLYQIKISDAAELDELLSAEAYAAKQDH
ncbi:MAG: glycine cleavage system protein GcvH [Paraperlucidibaca sp.]|jgi:glycine cleavage system H protein|uniref:glycine cleavage system protein GcvH n=1 Tax=Paraperlucidibaca sp. TaxID=2708021 RepID=UPI001B4A93B3|nr:glycine cleavage system protein GcvH [Paraperlucidibaca sp.]MBQ0722723.1 glycine cleavage system protein GcvH [Paraperlucidibaca sp.]MBQ0841847.1 glycine cleavage system protein GcvH [Paraperlucidibaca sp.]|tara:strand:- start:1478 stop:1861 length:384 start_codon:yes stop_codon:yes gene_type:complete